MKNKVMSKQELLDRREELLEEYEKQHPKYAKKAAFTKKERKVLGIGKDQGVATIRNLRVAPRKVSMVCDLIRNKGLDEAIAILTYTPHAASQALLKLVQEAAANAVNNNSLSRDRLFIDKIDVGQGTMLKRWRPRGKGSAASIHKKTSNISIVLKERA